MCVLDALIIRSEFEQAIQDSMSTLRVTKSDKRIFDQFKAGFYSMAALKMNEELLESETAFSDQQIGFMRCLFESKRSNLPSWSSFSAW